MSLLMYGVVVKMKDGYDSFCSFDGSEDYELTTSKSTAEQLLDSMRENHPKEQFTLVEVKELP